MASFSTVLTSSWKAQDLNTKEDGGLDPDSGFTGTELKTS